MSAIDILILSNGVGEVTTWVRHVVQESRELLGNNRSDIRISVVLSPCSHATGAEAKIAASYPEVDRVQGPEYFWQFLLRGKTADNWDWRERGVVVFLGGDQFFPIIIGKRLSYPTIVYAEWEARWYRWINRFGVMRPEIITQVPPKYADKFTVVGDLMAEAGRERGSQCVGQVPELKATGVEQGSQCGLGVPPSGATGVGQGERELVGLLPGSKRGKLAQGVPMALAIAEHVHEQRPQTQFVIPVAPTLELETLARFANSRQNPVVELFGGGGKDAELVIPATPQRPFLKTSGGVCVELWTDFPAYDLLAQCRLCVTTVGANTAELGALAVPMIVLLPTQQLDAMRTWDGLPGILANLPGLGSPLAKLINSFFLQKIGLLAWPNIWAKAEVVPELVGKIQPEAVAEIVLDWLEHPQKLQQIRERLRSIRGEPGAARKLAQIVRELVT